MDNKKLKNFIINILRRASFSWKPRGEAKKRFRVPNGTFKNGNPKFGYQCAKCKETFMSKDVLMDHIDPVVPLEGWDNFDGFIERMFCDESNFQCMCKECHDQKTKWEKGERVKHRKLQKEKECEK
jgi:5-methylcytosine-specific restriction endonuclease McrA